MGYSERWCHLCSVSFNVARIRTADEPQEAAWDYYGNGYVEEEGDPSRCSARGCSAHEHEELNNFTGEKCREHIAGPDCEDSCGYSGARINVEEMKPSLRVQCLAAKGKDWRPEAGDEDYDVYNKTCFTTGIGQGPPCEFDVEGLEPVKHGISESGINNCFENDDYVDVFALPMHPRCFEMFKTQSRSRFGLVDLDGLWKITLEHSDYDRSFPGLPLNTDPRLVSEQYYDHIPGTEYLATDPLQIPGLTELVRSCTVEPSTSCDTVFEASQATPGNRSQLDKLPPELRSMIMSLLSQKDVANLRLASKNFRQMPQEYFRKLVEDQMPWIKEYQDLQASNLDWHQLWIKLHAADGGSEADQKQRQRVNDLRGESDAELRARQDRGELGLDPDWARFNAEIDARIKADRATAKQPMPLGNELKGLRNRKRIYHEVEAILDLVEKYWEEHPEQRGNREVSAD